MNIAAIINDKEVWLPAYVTKAGVLERLNLNEVFTQYGIMLPASGTMNGYGAIKRGIADKYNHLKYDGNVSIVSDKGVMGVYSFRVNGAHFDVIYLSSTYRVVAGNMASSDYAAAATHMFNMGRLKTPQAFLKLLRKHWNNDIPFVKYTLQELLERRNAIHGDLEPFPLPAE